MTDSVSALQLMPGWTKPCGETVSRSSTTLSVRIVFFCSAPFEWWRGCCPGQDPSSHTPGTSLRTPRVESPAGSSYRSCLAVNLSGQQMLAGRRTGGNSASRLPPCPIASIFIPIVQSCRNQNCRPWMITGSPAYDASASAWSYPVPIPCPGRTHTIRNVRCLSIPGNSPTRLPMRNVCLASFHSIGIVAEFPFM